MKKACIALIIVGCSLLLFGGSLFAFGFGLAGWDLNALRSVQIVEKVYTEQTVGSIKSISVDFNVTDVKVIFSEDADKVTVTYPQMQNRKGKNISEIQINETEDSVSILENEISWWKNISLFGTPSATAIVKLPVGREYTLSVKTDTGDVRVNGTGTTKSFLIETDTGDVSLNGHTTSLSSLEIETDTGDIDLRNATIVCDGFIKLSTDTGNIRASDFTADSLLIETDTGDVTLNGNASLASKAEIKTDTGNVRMHSLTAASVKIDTDTGDISLGKLTGTSFFANVRTGNIKSISSEVLDFTDLKFITSTGDVKINLAGAMPDYSIVEHTNTGDSNIADIPPTYNQERSLEVRCSTGDIFVNFAVAMANN